MTGTGGADNLGLIFSINPKNGELTLLHSFSGAPGDGAIPPNSLTISGNNLYGMTLGGGVNDEGAIFKFNIETGQSTLLYSFGVHAQAGCNLTLSGTTFYGITTQGGANGEGVIFSLK